MDAEYARAWEAFSPPSSIATGAEWGAGLGSLEETAGGNHLGACGYKIQEDWAWTNPRVRHFSTSLGIW